MEDDIIFIKILRKLKKSAFIFTKQLAKTVRTSINPRFIKVFVFGKVFNTGNIIVSRSSSLNNAILLAGWAKVIKWPVKFLSYKSDSTIETRKFAYRKKNKREAYKNPLLKTGDIISFNRKIVNVSTALLDELIITLIVSYAAKEGFAKF